MASAQASTSSSICTLVTARRIGMLPSSGTSQAKPGSAAASRHPIIASFMQGKLTPAAGIVILMVAATSFAANHVSARVAFDHGASVAAGVLTRATGTALVLLLLMKLQGVAIAVPRALMPRLAGAGVLVAVQSYCLYSAVALIPAALALLVFQTSRDAVPAAVLGDGQGKAARSGPGADAARACRPGAGPRHPAG